MYSLMKSRVATLIAKNLLTQEDLFAVGEYLDDLEAVAASRTLATKVRNAVRHSIEHYILNGAGPETSKTCGRSWALGDLREQVLVRMEFRHPARIRTPSALTAQIA